MIKRIRSSKVDFFRLNYKRRVAGLILVMLLFITATILNSFLNAAQACSDPTGPLRTVVVVIDGIETTATTDGCTIFGVPVPIDPNTFCALAFSHGNNVIQEFLEVQALESGSPSRFTFAKDNSGKIARDFFPSTTANPVFAEGFFSPIPPNGIPPTDIGKPITFRMRIRLKRNATFEEIKADLVAPKGRIGLGKAVRDVNGIFTVMDNEHKKISDLGEITTFPNPLGAPTLSEWGVIILALLLLTVGTGFIVIRRPVITKAAASGTILIDEGIRRPLFIPAIFGKAVAGMLGIALVGIALVNQLFNPISAIDICGTLLCAVILAYLVHLLSLAARDS